MKVQFAIWLRFVLIFLIVSCSLANQPAVQPLPSNVTSMPSNELEPTSPPTQKATPPSTLPSTEAEEIIVEMLLAPACNLPCWWGITPNQTTQTEANQLLTRFSEITTSFEFAENGTGFIGLKITTKGTLINVIYKAEKEKIAILHVISGVYPQLFPVYNPENEYYDLMQNYSIAHVLQSFGPPNRIFLKSFDVNPFENLSHTLLYYPDPGVVFEYLSPTRHYQNDKGEWIAYTCPTLSQINLRLFDPAGKLGLETVMNFYDTFSDYKDLETISNMNINELMQDYSDGSCDKAIETPADIWPTS